MLLRGALVLLGLWGVSPILPPKTLLDGTAQLCPEDDAKGDIAGLRGVNVYAFDTRKTQKIRAALRSIEAVKWDGDGVEAVRTFSSEYAKLMAAIKATPQLGAATSNRSGDFQIMVPRVDSVLLFAEEAVEGEPFFFASMVIPTQERDLVKIIVPMCNK